METSNFALPEHALSGMVEAEVLPLNYTRAARDPSKHKEVGLQPRVLGQWFLANVTVCSPLMKFKTPVGVALASTQIPKTIQSAASWSNAACVSAPSWLGLVARRRAIW